MMHRIHTPQNFIKSAYYNMNMVKASTTKRDALEWCKTQAVTELQKGVDQDILKKGLLNSLTLKYLYTGNERYSLVNAAIAYAIEVINTGGGIPTATSETEETLKARRGQVKQVNET